MAIAAAVLTALPLSACGGTESGPRTFTVLQYENPTSPQGRAWQKAVEIFRAAHPDVRVDFQATSFDAVRQNAKITLSGSDVPDVIEFNKGNADGGQLAAQGLLENLTEEASQFGWDQKVRGTMAAFARYDQAGLAGSGDWYGVPNVGEYVTVYYNAAMFAEAGIAAPPTTIEEFERAMDALKAAGHVPISSSAGTSQGFNQMWVWYSLVSAQADRQQIDDFMFLRGRPDLRSGSWAEGTGKFQEWIEKGYLGEQLGGLTYEQAIVNFLGGDAAMVVWNNGEFDRMRNDAAFEVGSFTFPGARLVMGSSGHLWGVPANADDKDLAYDWISTTLSPEVQNELGRLGGLPVAGDTATIPDEAVRAFTQRFDDLVAADALSYYPDYPVPGFLDFIQNHMQAMSNRSETADQFLGALQTFYDDGKAAATQG